MVRKIVLPSVLLVALSFAATACRSGKPIKPENFEEFYQKFLTDEDFQLSRIEFPLDGCETDGENTTYWNSADDWTMLVGSVHDVDTSEFKVEKTYLPTKVVLKVYIEDSGYGVTQEYELEDGKWYLVMYDFMST